MKAHLFSAALVISILFPRISVAAPLPGAPANSGDGTVAISGDLKQWHKVTLTLDGPLAKEQDTDPNPFLDYRMTVSFAHESGSPKYDVPGYFAADGDAANSSATAGIKWRAHLSPDKPGRWNYSVLFVAGPRIAVADNAAGARRLAPFDGAKGTFVIAPTDKSGRDLRAKGRLQYVGKRYLQFAGTKEFFLKAGPDSPENFLAYFEFDGTSSLKKGRAARQGEALPADLHRYESHGQDWRAGDPTWKDGKGKNIIGALNYIASKGCNSFSFLPYNVGGDGEDVWPFAAPDDKLHYDCSKLAQWGIVFDHAQTLGLHLHFKLQEQENDDDRTGHDAKQGGVPAALDNGDLDVERKLYCRELIARFGHALALNWNLGEENTQSAEQQRAFAGYLRDTDPYDHNIVVHTFPDWQERVYPELVGGKSALTGASLQNNWDVVHQQTLKWVAESAKADKPWIVANDEQGPANFGVPPDPGYKGHSGKAGEGAKLYDMHDVRKRTLWGNLMAGGAGVEYYFGYQLPQNDLGCEDWRSRDKSWDSCRIALEFFREHRIPIAEMNNANALIGNEKNDNSKYCFAKAGEVYLVYLPAGGTTDLNLSGASGKFTVKRFNPRSGGPLLTGAVREVAGGATVSLGEAPSAEDWLIVVRHVR